MTRSTEQAITVADAVRTVNRATVSATRTRKGLPALPEAQIGVLSTLRRHPGLTPAELADRLSLARPTVSNLLRDLEAAGFVVRERSTTDRRSVELTLTDRARAVQDAFHHGRVEVVSAAWEALDDTDQQTLAAAGPALRRLADRLHAHQHQPPEQPPISQKDPNMTSLTQPPVGADS